MDLVIGHVWPAGCWPVSCMAKLQHSTLHAKFPTNFSHTSHAHRHHWFVPFYTAFSDLDLCRGSQGLSEAKSVGFVFLHTFQLIRMNVAWCWISSSWTSWCYSWVRFSDSRKKISAVLLTASKNVNTSMYLSNAEPVWFKLGMMTEPTELCILILAYKTMTLIQDHRYARKQNFLYQSSLKVLNRFRWNLACCCNVLVWWLSFSFISSNQYSRERTPLT